MGLLDMLQDSDLGLYGYTPSQIPSANPQSTLHYESSINDEPDIPQSPSNLSLEGYTPDQYLDNLPD